MDSDTVNSQVRGPNGEVYDKDIQETLTEAARLTGWETAIRPEALRRSLQTGTPITAEMSWRLLMLAEAEKQTAELRKVTAAIERLEARFPHVPAFLGKRRA